jgi:PPOX class probable F420-dependent enzyme
MGQHGVMDHDGARQAVAGARVARLATATRTGRIDLVPITFALVEDRLVTAVDHKPKTTTQLKRLENIRHQPEVSILVDEYDDADWDRLWWVRLRGLAQVVEDGPLHAGAIEALTAKYGQYQDRPPSGPAIVIELIRWQWWAATA